MLEVTLNELDLMFIELVRVGLSEETMDLRERAIKNVKHDVVADRIDKLMRKLGPKWRSDPANSEFLQWVALTAAQRTEAAFEFSETGKRYEAEEKTDLRGGIWINVGNQSAIYSSENDRIIHKWQSYAGRYDEKTIVKHLAAIRYFEQCLSGKSFGKLRIDDFAAVRDDLKRRADVTADDKISASSIKHTISYLGSFFDWLIGQEGYRRLPRDFRGYLVVPKAILAKSAQTKQKDFPSIEEAEQLLLDMPSASLTEMRSRAIFAVAFLGALRADTIASLRLRHIQIEQRLIIQDGAVSRTKAGKSITIFWFPIAKTFEEIVVEWIERLRMLGFQDNDALFPDAKWLKHKVELAKQIPIMSTTYAVTDAFKVASRGLTVPYTPHAAKHTIGAERDARPLTHQERKAWSLNMGHETEQITERHYGTMPEDQRFDVLENIGTDRASDVPQMTDEAKIALVDEVMEHIGRRKQRL